MSDDAKRWTDERRAQQRDACLEAKPWTKSSATGRRARTFVHEALHSALAAMRTKGKAT